jgi:sporulation integral membrane protein YlbJ
LPSQPTRPAPRATTRAAARRSAPNIIIAGLAAALTLSLVLFPDASLRAAKAGLDLFLTVVFPSLLPFFILSEVMLALGVVHFIGVLFEPLMRPVFNVPGEGAFALSMGLAAGYPMDAVIAARFRKLNLCNRVEGERLLAFTNTADPLFIFGAVAVGMFACPALGGALALAHYLSALSVGVVFRFYGSRSVPSGQDQPRTGSLLARATAALLKARQEDGRPLGRIMGDSVNESVKTLLMICGFIMLFSAFVAISGKIGLSHWLGWPFEVVLRGLGLETSLVDAAVSGVFEIDLGAVAASQAVAPLAQRAMMAGAVIAWSGLSVHGQVASVITGTDIRMGPYVLARLLHAALAAVYTLFLVPVLLGPGWAGLPPTAGTMLTGSWSPAGIISGGPLAWLGSWGLVFGRNAVVAGLLPLGMALAGSVAALLTGPVRQLTRLGRPGRRDSRG